MKYHLIKFRNSIVRFFYQSIFKKIAFRIDPEQVHDHIVILGIALGSNWLTRKITSCLFSYNDPRLEQIILNICFANPVGLSAGFDKNAQLTKILPAVGFGFAEVGSITGEPCTGNPKPRLWRLKQSQALVVYYGLKNDGCVVIAQRLSSQLFSIPVGISIAKTNSANTVEITAGIADYVKAFQSFVTIGDYWTINISCPNAFGGEPFTDPQSLNLLLNEIDTIVTTKPIFLKLSPDLSHTSIDAIIEIVRHHRVHGFVCTNLTKQRHHLTIVDTDIPTQGGISGKVMEQLADSLIAYLYRQTRGQYVIIGVGGIFSADDAYRKIRLGASLVQLITGMVFEGPQLISDINLGLVRLLERDGYTTIAEAVGTANQMPLPVIK